MDTSNHRATLGHLGEALAARHLADLGCSLVGRNIRKGRDELDIVIRHHGRLAIVEVKSTADGADPVEAVDDAKVYRIERAAHALGLAGYRMDIVAVRFTPRHAEVRWLQGIA